MKILFLTAILCASLLLTLLSLSSTSLPSHPTLVSNPAQSSGVFLWSPYNMNYNAIKLQQAVST